MRPQPRGGAVVAFAPDLIDAAVVSGPATDTPILAVDHAAEGPVAAYVLVPDGNGYHLALAEADDASDGADLTRAIRSLPSGVPLVPVADQSSSHRRNALHVGVPPKRKTTSGWKRCWNVGSRKNRS